MYTYETYRSLKFLFPKLPNELWLKICWYLLRSMMEEKIKMILPLEEEFDMFERLSFEDLAWDHSHTTIMANDIMFDPNIIYYDHVFYTDCSMWYEAEGEDIIESVSPHEQPDWLFKSRASEIFYKTHTFGLVKRRKEDPTGEYRVNYVVQIYLDGSAKLVSVDFE